MGILFIPYDIYMYGQPQWADTDMENRRTRRKTCPIATLSTTNPTWTDLDANQGLHSERLAINSSTLSTTNPMWTDLNANQGLHSERLAINSMSLGMVKGILLDCGYSNEQVDW
jgi:hypothetical protein